MITHILSVCLILSVSAGKQLPKRVELPPHFSGLGLYTFKEVVDVDPVKMAAEARALNVSYILVKSHDGGTWGTKVKVGKRRQWRSALTPELVKAYHDQGIRVYAYFTTRLNLPDKKMAIQASLADKALDLGIDGIVPDDWYVIGIESKYAVARAKLLFERIRKSVNDHPGTVLATSMIPNHLRIKNRTEGFRIAIKHSNYCLLQVYPDYKGHKKNNAWMIQYAQGAWNTLIKKIKMKHCQMIPTGQSYRPLSTEEISKFLEYTFPYYRSVALFRWKSMPRDAMPIVDIYGAKFMKLDRKIIDPNTMNLPDRDDKPILAKQTPPPKKSKPPRRRHHRRR